MEKGADKIKKPVHALVTKKKLFRKEDMQGAECVIVSSVTAGITVLEIPQIHLAISVNTHDVLAALNLANARYQQIREQERNNPLVEE